MKHEAEVHEQLKFAQPPPFPQTPIQRDASFNKPDQPAVSTEEDQYSSSQILKTSFTKTKRKEMLRDILNHDDSGDYSNHNLNGNKDSLRSTFATDDPFTHSSQLPEYARKAARTSLFATSDRFFTERQENRTASLPILNSRDRMASTNRTTSQLQLLQSADTSPTSGRFYDRTSLYGNEESDLATAILKLIRSDNLKLKAFTEVQVRHKIGLALDVSETKLRRYEETISEDFLARGRFSFYELFLPRDFSTLQTISTMLTTYVLLLNQLILFWDWMVYYFLKCWQFKIRWPISYSIDCMMRFNHK